MTARLTGVALLLLGAALAVLPALTWFTAPPPGRPTGASGFSAAGSLWLLPVVGALVVLSGAGLLAARPGAARAAARWAGPLALVAGLLALGFALWAAADPSLTLRVTAGGVTEQIPVAVDLAPAAYVAPAVAAAAALVGAATTWAGRRR